MPPLWSSKHDDLCRPSQDSRQHLPLLELFLPDPTGSGAAFLMSRRHPLNNLDTFTKVLRFLGLGYRVMTTPCTLEQPWAAYVYVLNNLSGTYTYYAVGKTPLLALKKAYREAQRSHANLPKNPLRIQPEPPSPSGKGI